MPRKPWSKIIEEHGVRVRLYERGGRIWRAVVTGSTESQNGKRRPIEDRASLKHGDRKLAEKQAKALCAAIAEQRLTGYVAGDITLKQLRDVYLLECGALLKEHRKGEVRKAFGLLIAHLDESFSVADLGPHQTQTYTAARQSGTLQPEGGRHIANGVRAGTIAKELGCLHAALNWASTFRRNGRPLIPGNPLRGVSLPSELNPSRPVATRERYVKMLEQANGIDGSGRFRMMLELAWMTGRRLGAIVALRAGDVLLTPDQVQRALGAAGMDEQLAEHWPAAISWAAEADKEGVHWIVPIPEQLRAALAEYVRRRGVVGNALLFPAERDSDAPVSKETAHYWWKRAEQLAGLPRQNRGGWHMLRRAWATARKGMPLQDVMAAGGWRNPVALQRAYQHADPATVRAVMDVGT